jgi:hypothetical protein
MVAASKCLRTVAHFAFKVRSAPYFQLGVSPLIGRMRLTTADSNPL